MKKAFIIIVSVLLSVSVKAIDKDSVQKKVQVVTISPQGSNDGIKMYKVTISDGRVFEYMYIGEIQESIRTGKWAYNEMLEYNKK